MTDPDAFDPAKVADIVRGRALAPRLTRVQEAARMAAIEAARDEDMTRRAEAAHLRRIARAEEEAAQREAEAQRAREEPADVVAARVAARLRRF